MIRHAIAFDRANGDTDSWPCVCHFARALSCWGCVVFEGCDDERLVTLALHHMTPTTAFEPFRSACASGKFRAVQALLPLLHGSPGCVKSGFANAVAAGQTDVCKWLFHASSVLRAASASQLWAEAFALVSHPHLAAWMLNVSHRSDSAISPLGATRKLWSAIEGNGLLLAQHIAAVCLRRQLTFCVSAIHTDRRRAHTNLRTWRWASACLPALRCNPNDPSSTVRIWSNDLKKKGRAVSVDARVVGVAVAALTVQTLFRTVYALTFPPPPWSAVRRSRHLFLQS